MRQKEGLRLSKLCIAWLLLTSLTSCGNPPPVVSGDLSCERFRHIHANDAQRSAIASDWDLWESFATQVAEHNVEYDKDCLEKKP